MKDQLTPQNMKLTVFLDDQFITVETTTFVSE